jgi:hypothetical protein
MFSPRGFGARANGEEGGVRAVLAALVLAVLAAPPARAAECPNAGATKVPGAERQEVACLDDLTTAGTARTGHTDESDWAGLSAAGQVNPTGVPGLQVDGYFPDASTANTEHGWNHDAQFVLRFPNHWNGKLVITGAPGVRKQYANDFIIGDWLLGRGYAYASTDKGNDGNEFYADGAEPGDAGAEWNFRVTQLAIAAKQAVASRYGRGPARTYVTGLSQGGYLTRWQIEHRPDLYDGGVDWEGTLWTTPTTPLLTTLPVALRNFPRYRATGDQAAHDAMIAAGFAPGSEFLWPDHYAVYWDLTQRTYREEFDPAYDGSLEAGVPFCQSGTPGCDADYDAGRRSGVLAGPLAKVALTGRLGKPMITLHGTLDSLLPIRAHADPYVRMIRAAGAGALHRYYVIEDGNHVDGRYDAFPDRLRPIQPCWRQAFAAMEGWAERGTAPPASQYVPRSGGDLANACALAAGQDVPAPGAGRSAPPSVVGRTHPRGLRVRVTPRRDRRRPFRFTTRGRVLLPAGITRAQACGSGTVAVQVHAGGRTVSTRRSRLRRTARSARASRSATRGGSAAGACASMPASSATASCARLTGTRGWSARGCDRGARPDGGPAAPGCADGVVAEDGERQPDEREAGQARRGHRLVVDQHADEELEDRREVLEHAERGERDPDRRRAE